MTQHDNHGRFIWHELMTSDPAAAETFYHEVVGWTASPWGDTYTLFMNGELPAAGLMILPEAAKAMGTPPNWLAYIEVGDVDAIADKAVKLGGSVVVPAQTVPEVGRFAVFKDPQGAVFAAITSEKTPSEETDPKNLEFSWHELVTTDYEAAVEFYQSLFGWEKKSEYDMGEPMGIYYMFGRDRFTYGGIFNKPADMPAPPHWLHYIQVPGSADAAAERATHAGGTVINGPMEVPGGDRIAAILDPQGAEIAVHSKASVAATV